ncbi:hypothetical protein HK098_003009 [Nowakowskiella sp. JEL0407]|nr:hypothetical protein HK098_003009 [Nowakowskiella sp. JEL0407]
MIAPLFDSPNCDLGKTTVSPLLRRQIGIVTAMVSECSYCSAHSAGLGDAMTGSRLQPKFENEEIKILPHEVDEKTRIALRLVVAAVKVPSRVTPKMRADVIEAYGRDGLEKICGVMGWLAFMSTFTDTLGCELEVEAAEHAYRTLKKAGWRKTHTVPRKTTYSRYENEKIGTSCFTSMWGSNKVTDFLDLARNIVKASRYDAKLLRNFPKKSPALEIWFAEHFGPVFSPIKHMSNFEVRRAMAFNLWRFILASADEIEQERDKPTILSNDKVIISFIFFYYSENHYLAAHFARLASRRNIPPRVLLKYLEFGRNWAPLSYDKNRSERTFLTHACMLTFLVAKRLRSSTFKLTAELFEISGHNARRCVELIALFGMLSMLQRMNVALSGNEEYEPELQDFLKGEYARKIKFLKKPKETVVEDMQIFVVQKVWAGFVNY